MTQTADGTVETNPHVLEKAICYLIGSMQFTDDNGQGWRQEICSKASQKDIRIDFINPAKKPGNCLNEDIDNREILDSLKQNNCRVERRRRMRKIKRFDLRAVDYSDFVIIAVDTKYHACGSYFEAAIAELQRKPILAIVKGGWQSAPEWLADTVVKDHELFSSVDECVAYLDLINRKIVDISEDSRWVLIRKFIGEINNE